MHGHFDAGAVLEAVPSNYLILDAELNIAGVTDAYCAATMTVRQEIVGRPLFEVFPDNPDDPAADGVRVLRAYLHEVLATRKPHRMKVQKYDIRRPDADGGGFEERYWSPLNSPVLAADGSVSHIVHWVEDVTDFIRMKREMEREQAEMTEELRSRADKLQAEVFLRTEALEANKRLSESERRYRFLADSVPQLMWTADGDGMIDYCNERWFSFTGLTLRDLSGRGWLGCVHPDDVARVAASWDAAVASSVSVFNEEHRLRHRDGTWRFMLTSAVPYRNHSDRVLQWFGTSTDIHERVLANEQLRDTQRLQSVGQLAGGMAHEVNNMMTAVTVLAACLRTRSGSVGRALGDGTRQPLCFWRCSRVPGCRGDLSFPPVHF
jgi:PAS domain S-box-containing protein